MKRFFKWVFRIFLVLFLLLLILIVFLDRIARAVAEHEIHSRTGLDVRIGKLSISLRSPTLEVDNFRIWNSSEFGDSIFLDVPQLRVQYDLDALRNHRVRLNLVRLQIGELHVVQDKNGRTNLQALRERAKAGDGPSGDTRGTGLTFQGIDTLLLTIGRLKFTSERNPAKNEEAYVGMKNETLKGVISFEDLQPLAARIALEKDLKFISENLFRPGTNSLHNAARSPAPDPTPAAPGPLKK